MISFGTVCSGWFSLNYRVPPTVLEQKPHRNQYKQAPMTSNHTYTSVRPWLKGFPASRASAQRSFSRLSPPTDVGQAPCARVAHRTPMQLGTRLAGGEGRGGSKPEGASTTCTTGTSTFSAGSIEATEVQITRQASTPSDARRGAQPTRWHPSWIYAHMGGR